MTPTLDHVGGPHVGPSNLVVSEILSLVGKKVKRIKNSSTCVTVDTDVFSRKAEPLFRLRMLVFHQCSLSSPK